MRKLEPPLSELSLAEKLDLMESLWAELTKDEKALKSPAWHETILKDREEALAAGKEIASDWEKAKKRIRKKVS
jgi:putative addiction module component (TIGR02574 family)